MEAKQRKEEEREDRKEAGSFANNSLADLHDPLTQL